MAGVWALVSNKKLDESAKASKQERETGWACREGKGNAFAHVALQAVLAGTINVFEYCHNESLRVCVRPCV